MKQQLTNIMSQEMDRKDFLRYTGIALLMLVGGGAIMQALGSLTQSKQLARPTSSSSSYGYGSSAYGGNHPTS